MSAPPRVSDVIVRARDFERAVRFYREVVRLPLASGRNDAEGDPWIGGARAELSWREGAYLHFAIYPASDACPPCRGGASSASTSLRTTTSTPRSPGRGPSARPSFTSRGPSPGAVPRASTPRTASSWA